MNTILINFIKNHQIALINIYIQEYTRNGPGALFVMETEKDNNKNVNVAYYPKEKIEVEKLKQELEIKMEEITDVEEFKIENKIIYSLPAFEESQLEKLPAVFFVITDKNGETI